MAEIQLRNVSFNYSTTMSSPMPRWFEMRRESKNLEDMPAEKKSGVAVLDDITLTIPDGQTFVVVGPSGCNLPFGYETAATGTVLLLP